MEIKFDANKKKLDTNPVFGLLVQGENLAESIQITGPKMVGALDLSQLRVAVRMTSQQYETTVEKTLEQATDGDTITFTWQVDKQFTGSPGNVDVMLVGYGGNEEVIKITSSGMVVQEDRTFDTAPPESTWEQILQQMQDFATQAYESKTAAENSAAAAANSQRVTEEKAAQATEAASTAAAQAAAKTEQQIRQYADDRYARPLVTKTGPAASLEVYPDRLSNLKVYANGFTTQEGEGDPSPKNVQKLTNGGLKLVELVVSTENASNWTTAGSNGAYALVGKKAKPTDNAATATIFCTILSRRTANEIYGGTKVGIAVDKDGTIEIKLPVSGLTPYQYVSAYGSFTIWYQPTAESEATGLYAPIPIVGGEYIATCLKLTKELCEGDSVVNWTMSGCDIERTFDGSSDENWIKSSGSATGTGGSVRFQIEVSAACNNTNPAALSTAYSDTYPQATANQTYGSGYDNTFSVAGQTLHVRIAGISTVESLKQYLAVHPLTVWYRSTNYTEANDIPVSLETHWAILYELTGKEAYVAQDIWKPGAITINSYMANAVRVEGYNVKADIVCTHLTTVTAEDVANRGIQGCAQGGGANLFLCFGESYNTKELAVQYIKDQYEADTPVQIKAKRATPLVYAHPAVRLPAYPDDTGKVTITGQSGGTVTVEYNKSLIKELAEMRAAMLAMGAQLSM